MRGTVSKRLGKQAKQNTVGKEEWETRLRKKELKQTYTYMQRLKFINPAVLSKRQQRLAA